MRLLSAFLTNCMGADTVGLVTLGFDGALDIAMAAALFSGTVFVVWLGRSITRPLGEAVSTVKQNGNSADEASKLAAVASHVAAGRGATVASSAGSCLAPSHLPSAMANHANAVSSTIISTNPATSVDDATLLCPC